MARIKVNIDGLRSNQADIDKKIGELQQLNSKLDALINTIGAEWEGDASKAYQIMMTGYLKKAKKQEQVLREVKKYIQQAIARFEATDKKSAAKIRGSF